MYFVFDCLIPSMLHAVYSCSFLHNVFQCCVIATILIVLNHFKFNFSFSFTRLFIFFLLFTPPYFSRVNLVYFPFFFLCSRFLVPLALLHFSVTRDLKTRLAENDTISFLSFLLFLTN